MSVRARLCFAWLVSVTTAGCVSDSAHRWTELRTPFETEYQRENLRVDLPGVGGSIRDARAHGLVDRLQSAQEAIERVASRTVGGDHEDAALVERLRRDSLNPTVGRGSLPPDAGPGGILPDRQLGAVPRGSVSLDMR